MKQNVILIAEDDYEDRFIISEGFRSFNQDNLLRFFDHGVGLMEYLKTERDENVTLVVLDLNMPLMNGTETLRELKKFEEYRHIPVIVLSTSDNEIERSASYQLGANGYKIKPSKFDEYLALCKELYEINRVDGMMP